MLADFSVHKIQGWTVRTAAPVKDIEAFFTSFNNTDAALPSSRGSIVQRVPWGDGFCVVKAPIDRDRRCWGRVASLYRGSAAWRLAASLDCLQRNGFRVPRVLMIAEQRRWGMALRSFMVMEWLESRAPDQSFAQQVHAELLRLHAMGMTRRDPQLKNFLSVDGQVYFIDCTPRRHWLPFWRRFVIFREYAYFISRMQDGYPGWVSPDQNISASYWYGIAQRWYSGKSWWKRCRRRVRRILFPPRS